MKIHYIEQRTDEWFELKLGKVSGSNVKRMMGREWKIYADEIVSQRLAPNYDFDGFTSDAMQRGIDLEPFAKQALEEERGFTITEVGFAQKDDYCGLSPDGLVFIDNAPKIGCEFKALDTKNHITIIRTNEVPKKHLDQCLFYFFAVDTLETVLFTSYDDRLRDYPKHTIELKREDFSKELEKMQSRYEEFVKLVEQTENLIKSPF